MSYPTNPIIGLFIIILDIYWYIVVAAVIVSWLVVFNVINSHNNVVYSIRRALDALTEPVFRRVRKMLPPIGGLDLSPLVVLVAISWLRFWVLPWLAVRLAF